MGWRGYDAGGKLKEVGTSHWNNPNTGATNGSGFTALPAGGRGGSSGSFQVEGYGGYFWSSSVYSSAYAWSRYMRADHQDVGRYYGSRPGGFSLRCFRDQVIDRHQ